MTMADRIIEIDENGKVHTDDYVRVFRLVEYVGPRALVEKQIEASLHGTRWGFQGRERRGVRITATTLGIGCNDLLSDEQRAVEVERSERSSQKADQVLDPAYDNRQVTK
ncbi:MAG TPA: hypothetical protein VFO16_01550 [Pseudonocardiaceae bacterium]|nr:hypothetical protein [Pseudonocardiaceae bacterium]